MTDDDYTGPTPLPFWFQAALVSSSAAIITLLVLVVLKALGWI